jgi:hypothetical protein
MAKVDKLSFGSIVIDGEKYSQDVVILSDGRVKNRGHSFLAFGSHNIRKEEVEELAQGEPETMIIGTGIYGIAGLAADAENWTKEKNVNLIVEPSHDAVARLNELTRQGKGVAALIHITC